MIKLFNIVILLGKFDVVSEAIFDNDCGNCDATGFMQGADVTDEITLPIDLDSDSPVALPTDFAGF